jgi:hypothetical protein
VRIDERVLAGAVELIAHDLTATLGWDHARAQAEARDALDNRMQFLLIDLAWEQFDPAPGRRSSRTGWWRRSRSCSSGCTTPSGHHLAGVPAPPAASAVALGKTTVAGPGGAARAMMRAIAPLGTAGAAG